MLDKLQKALPTVFQKAIPNQKWINDACAAVDHTPDTPMLGRSDFHHLFVYCNMQKGRSNHRLLGGDYYSKFIVTGFTEGQYHMWVRLPDPPPISLPQQEQEESLTSEEIKKGYCLIPVTAKRALVMPPPPPFTVSEPVHVPIPKTDPLDTTEWTERNRFHNRFDHWAKIKGELWLVRSELFPVLDKFMENGVLFRRKRILVEAPIREISYFTETISVPRSTRYPDGKKEVDSTEVEREIYAFEAFIYEAIPERWLPLIDGGYLYQAVTIYNNSSLNRKFYVNTKLEE